MSAARPQVGPVGDEGHAARDDELGGDEAVDEHAEHEQEQEADLVALRPYGT